MPNINYDIDKELHKRAKYKALELDMTLKNLVMAAIDEFVDTK